MALLDWRKASRAVKVESGDRELKMESAPRVAKIWMKSRKRGSSRQFIKPRHDKPFNLTSALCQREIQKKHFNLHFNNFFYGYDVPLGPNANWKLCVALKSLFLIFSYYFSKVKHVLSRFSLFFVHILLVLVNVKHIPFYLYLRLAFMVHYNVE